MGIGNHLHHESLSDRIKMQASEHAPAVFIASSSRALRAGCQLIVHMGCRPAPFSACYWGAVEIFIEGVPGPTAARLGALTFWRATPAS